MIHILEGNILNAKENIIGHQVNCMGKYNSGLAKQIREAYPTAYSEYMNYFINENPYAFLGKCQIVKVEDGRYIANLFGQLNYGRKPLLYTDYTALRRSLSFLENYAQLFNKSVALPFNLGCGLANGEWHIVFKIIKEVFVDSDVTIYRYTEA
jgi:O-acetyl-ADP-ribose deacetylase (regulator of RNase III)